MKVNNNYTKKCLSVQKNKNKSIDLKTFQKVGHFVKIRLIFCVIHDDRTNFSQSINLHKVFFKKSSKKRVVD